jgi:hypothetical protein
VHFAIRSSIRNTAADPEKIGTRMVELLGLKLGGHYEAPLVPRMPTRVEATGRRAK